VDRTRKNTCRGPDGRRASSFFGLSTASKTIYELIGLGNILDENANDFIIGGYPMWQQEFISDNSKLADFPQNL